MFDQAWLLIQDVSFEEVERQSEADLEALQEWGVIRSVRSRYRLLALDPLDPPKKYIEELNRQKWGSTVVMCTLSMWARNPQMLRQLCVLLYVGLTFVMVAMVG